MKIINKQELKYAIFGSSLLGTGGGGTIEKAMNILKEIKKDIKLISFSDLDKESLICTVFGVGGKQKNDPIAASMESFSIFQKILKKKIEAIIPVEVGPMAIANTAFIASELMIPLFDSDIVGLRSSPEVFLETITLSNLSRTPCVISDGKKNTKIIVKKINIFTFEKLLREFAINCGGDAFVAGYPLKIKDLIKKSLKDSITISLTTGQLLEKLKNRQISLEDFCQKSEWKFFGEGVIINQNKDDLSGFTSGRYLIKSKEDLFQIDFKNENIVLIKNKKIILTCPDSISLLETKKYLGVNNFDDNLNKNVLILGKKAIPIWRTEKGRKLFSPKKLGLNYKQKLLT